MIWLQLAREPQIFRSRRTRWQSSPVSAPLRLVGARVLVPDGGLTPADVVITGDRIAHVGPPGSGESYDSATRVDLHDAVILPAFVDAHVHTVQTGQALDGLDLTGIASREATLDAVAAHVRHAPRQRVHVAAGWDETLWADPMPLAASELERAAPGVAILLSRIDGHSAVASAPLLDLVPRARTADGYSPDGRVERAAKLELTLALNELVGPDDRLESARVAMREMKRQGIAAFHEAAAPHIGPEYELDLVRQAAGEAGLDARLYWGEAMAFEKVAALGVAGLAGDLNADGALGSRTAALRTPYADRDALCGHAFLDAERIAEHVVGCTTRGFQAGFHCIGEAALDAIGAGFARAEASLGTQALRRARHRLEHVEMASPDVLAVLARCGVVASVQPMFDALWGGPDAMYADRVGSRWADLNRFADHRAAGLTLAFGSDAPVTALGPWDAIAAATPHRTPGQSLSLADAIRAHTQGGWRAARVDDAGEIREGQRAYLAAWDAVELSPGMRPDLVALFAAGRALDVP